MPTEYIKIKRKVKEIPDIRSFNGLLEASTLSDLDKEILRMHYLQEREFSYIADVLGYNQKTIEARHRKALLKISKLF